MNYIRRNYVLLSAIDRMNVVFMPLLNKMVVLDAEHYGFLEKTNLVSDPEMTLSEQQFALFNDLRQQGYYAHENSDSERDILAKTKSQYLRELSSGKTLQGISLQISNSCNFSCPNCIAKTIETPIPFMSFETAKRSLDEFIRFKLRHDSAFSRMQVSFTGKEPCANFRLIEQIEEYLKHAYAEIEHKDSMVSNLSLLDEERIRFLKDHQIHVTASLDGNEEANNMNRIMLPGKQNTFELTVSKLQLFQKLDYAIDTVNMVVTAKSAPLLRVEEFISLLANLGVKSLSVSFDDTAFGSIPTIEKVRVLLEVLEDAEKHKIRIDGDFGRTFSALTRKSCLSAAYSYCNAVLGAAVCVDSLGRIRGCNYMKASDLDISELEHALMPEGHIYELVNTHFPGNNTKCSNCDFEASCLGGCAVSEEYLSEENRSAFCEYTRIVTKMLIDRALSQKKYTK